MVKLSKIFQYWNQEIKVEADYDCSDDSIDDVTVWLYDSAKKIKLDITQLVDHHFSEILEGIDWYPIYHEYLHEAAEAKAESYAY